MAIAVILTVLNEAEALPRLLESLAAQTDAAPLDGGDCVTHLKFRVATFTVNALQFAVTLFLFATVQDAGSAYLMVFGMVFGRDAEFPALTEHVALPLLRIAVPDPHDRPITLWWVWLVCGAVLLAPVVTFIAT